MNNKPEVNKELKSATEEVKAETPEIKKEDKSGAKSKKAYWNTERSGFTQKSNCSHCGAAAMAVRGSNDETLTPFCPMCGYIMK